ncbi:hypothetical protein DSO57_1020427 [Entomophthora muscae]|uniref:Uncharacterized protein n=1 Tax=Entomophthora muscae TaxID=34485 RepID=A0ACC2RUW2_9FUNG|nr:hypothetical protein DSO57_1020427 [Entomophthora muscae]
MSKEAPNKQSAILEGYKGTIQEKAGWVLGSKKMQEEGILTKAYAEDDYNEALQQGYSEGVNDKFVGCIKENIGMMLGNEEMEADGKAQRAKGDAKQLLNAEAEEKTQ